MVRWIAVGLLTGAGLASTCAASAPADKLSGMGAVLQTESTAPGAMKLPAAPPAKSSTIFGGSIANINPVLDEFSLNIDGQRPLKVLFDERTQLYRDGVRIPLHDLAPTRYASVQTALDGTSIFALSVHILSQPPTGDFRGRVLSYDQNSGRLRLSPASGPPFTVYVAPSATFERTGQTSFTAQPSGRWDLKPGALVSVTFTTSDDRGIANHVLVFAVPGSTFAFSGSIANLNTASGTFTLVDPRDQRSYQLHFYPDQLSSPLHLGERVRVDATFDGSSYAAVDISPY